MMSEIWSLMKKMMMKKSNSISINKMNKGKASLPTKAKRKIIKEGIAEAILTASLMTKNSNRT